MGASYRLFGVETSPYTTKVRSYLRYKKLPFDWTAKTFGTDEEFRALSTSDALPMLVSPKGGVAHDSSLILFRLEATRKPPTATPQDPACRALVSLLEDYADEWLSKVMFHFRWGSAKAAKASAARQAEEFFAGYDVENLKDIEKSIAKSMTSRLKVIGITKKTVPVLEASFERFITLLNAHLEHHLFLFGGHPSIADFALAGQLIQMSMDEKPAAMMKEKAPFVTAWCEFMEDPRPGAAFESLDTVQDTLLPLIRDEVVPTYLTWINANNESIGKKRKTVTVALPDGEFKQSVQHHTARSFEYVTAAFSKVAETDAFAAFMKEAGLAETFTLAPPKPEKPKKGEKKNDKTDDTSEETSEDNAETASEDVVTAVVPDETDNEATPTAEAAKEPVVEETSTEAEAAAPEAETSDETDEDKKAD